MPVPERQCVDASGCEMAVVVAVVGGVSLRSSRGTVQGADGLRRLALGGGGAARRYVRRDGDRRGDQGSKQSDDPLGEHGASPFPRRVQATPPQIAAADPFGLSCGMPNGRRPGRHSATQTADRNGARPRPPRPLLKPQQRELDCPEALADSMRDQAPGAAQG